MTREQLQAIKQYRIDNMRCWSCGEKANYPMFISDFLCDKHKKQYYIYGSYVTVDRPNFEKGDPKIYEQYY